MELAAIYEDHKRWLVKHGIRKILIKQYLALLNND